LVPPVKIDDETISSSAIRQYIESGNVEKGSAMLGRNYSFTLPVVHGKTLGRKLGAPTLNQTIPEGVLIPSFGVYATRATVGGKTYCAVTNIGTNPTVSEDKTVKCETHILGFSGDIYGETVKTEFLKKLRGEMKFSGKDDLAAAIAADIRAAKQYFDLD
jgi:riboflavin kinase/FMN adenylyltransferase